MNRTLKAWIEAMRLRTLPVSLAGVVMAWACSLTAPAGVRELPLVLCFVFALLAQIASNFANEYYDFRAGLDRPGREGPRRGVTEGDITPRAMKCATFLTLGLACVTGLWLVAWGGWWLIAVGVAIAAGVLAYSAGPWPLSRHGLGEIAVIFFFGIIPVEFTYMLATGLCPDTPVTLTSVAVGLMGANVLIVNNYRDRDDDMAVGKHTLAVILGRKAVAAIYLLDGFAAVALMLPLWVALPAATWVVPAVYLGGHTVLWNRLRRLEGHALNPLLGLTAIIMFAYSLATLLCIACAG